MVSIAQTTNVNLEQTKSALEKIGESIFDGKSLIILLVSMTIAILLGSFVAFLLRRLTRSIARMADATSDLGTVNRLRRVETIIIILIAILRLFLVIIAVYFWWVYTHPNGTKPSTIIGAGALTAVIIGGAITPLLRDFSFGAGMMAERWYGVGDLITIEFPAVQGVVERITLRSTRIRGLNGEVIWVANQTITGVRVAQKGVWATAVELFVNDLEKGKMLVERANKLLPGGLAMLVSPLKIVDIQQRDKDIWHITAVGETAPGRDWILVTTALEVFKRLDSESKKPILIVDPIARFADKDTERQFARAVKNARKTKKTFNYKKVVTPSKKVP